MHLVTIEATMDFDADAVWAIVGDLGNLKAWSRAVEDCTLEGSGAGCHRLIRVAGGGQIRERLDDWDPAGRQLTYTPVSGSSLPVRDLRATITVTPVGPARSRILWRIDGHALGDADAVVGLLRARYGARLDELRTVLAGLKN